MRSDYNYFIIDQVVVIEDLNLGNKSVTNDIENIITELKIKIPYLEQKKIIYKDSMGIFDGIKLKDGKFLCFYPIQETELREAIKKAII